MRPLEDKNGYQVKIESINGWDAYAGLLEGTPFFVRRMRLMEAEKLTKEPGNYFAGIPELEAEAKERTKDDDVWPDCERWKARLVGEVDWQRHCRSFVVVHWYQEGGDPIERLKEILAVLDLRQYVAEEKYYLD